MEAKRHRPALAVDPRARNAYPELECHSRGDFGWLGDERYCTGRLGALQVWFGGDPVDVIVVARGGMSDS